MRRFESSRSSQAFRVSENFFLWGERPPERGLFSSRIVYGEERTSRRSLADLSQYREGLASYCRTRARAAPNLFPVSKAGKLGAKYRECRPLLLLGPRLGSIFIITPRLQRGAAP
jgi:hypothetical protein